MINTFNMLLITFLGLFVGVSVFAEEPELSVSPGDQNSLQIKIRGNVENRATESEFGKIGDFNTVKLARGIIYAEKTPPCANNLTLCGTVRVSGQKGIIRIIQYGAGNLITPGYRLSAKVNDGKVYLDLLMAGFPDGKDQRYCVISSKGKTYNSGEWIFFTVVINRGGKAEIFVNGALVGSGLVKSLEKDNLMINNVSTEINQLENGDVSMELASLEVYYSLLSSVEIDKLKDKWCDILKK